MKLRSTTTLTALLASILFAAGAHDPVQESRPEEDDALAGLVQRGRHLVHEVGHCIQCHTPRDDEGALLDGSLLEGAAVPIRPPDWAEGGGRGWAFRAPHIAGLPGYTDEEAVRLLVEGVDPSGEPPRRPMPPFRLHRDEARAVVAYLRSLE